jgi:hypothetical protein
VGLDATVLAGLIQSNIEAITDYPAPGQHPIFQDTRILLAISQAIVSHIQSAAVVEPGTFEVPGFGAVVGMGTVE